jgi:hypothetical protein
MSVRLSVIAVMQVLVHLGQYMTRLWCCGCPPESGGEAFCGQMRTCLTGLTIYCQSNHKLVGMG